MKNSKCKIVVNKINFLWKVSEKNYTSVIYIWNKSISKPLIEIEFRNDNMWYGVFEYVPNEMLMECSTITPKTISKLIEKIMDKFNISNLKEILKLKYYKDGEVYK